MIKRVRLKNWRSHLDSELSFAPGTNALVGILGSGKTSILDAICFALFGTFPTLQARKLKLDEVIMARPSPKDRCEVEVWFRVGDTTYSVKRTIERGKGTTYSELRANGKLVEAPNTSRVTELVEKILKVRYDLFSKAIYSEQNALDYFLLLPRGQRKQKIDQLLAIDRFERARANTVTLTHKLVERKLARQSLVEAADVDELKKTINELKSSLAHILQERGQIEQRVAKLAQQMDELNTELTELRRVVDELNKLKADVKGIESIVKETSDMLEKLEVEVKEVAEVDLESRLAGIRKEVERAEAELESKRKRCEEVSSKLSDLRARLEVLETERLARLRREVEEKLAIRRRVEEIRASVGEPVEEKLHQKKEVLQKLVREIEGLKVRIETLNRTLEELSSAVGRCPVCESRLSEKRKAKLIEQRKSQVAALERKLKKLKESERVGRKEVEELEGVVKKLDEMLLRIRDFEQVRADLKRAEAAASELGKAALATERQLAQLRTELEGVEKDRRERLAHRQRLEIICLRVKEYRQKKVRLKELTRQREELNERITRLEERVAGRDLEELERKLRELTGQKSQAEGRLPELARLADEKKLRLDECEHRLADILKAWAEIHKLEGLIRQLKIFAQALESTQIGLREEFIETVNHTMGRLWPTLYPYQDYTAVKLAIEGGDYVLKLQTYAGDWVDVEGVASGGERSIACLALRIAFALVLAPQLRWVILDEPTHNLDAAAVRVLASTLRERIGEFVDQIFVISHNPEMENAITGAAYRLERDKTRDSPTRVVKIG